MNQYILLMFEDAKTDSTAGDDQAWAHYFQTLHTSGRFDGGSAIGAGACFTKTENPKPVTPHLTGFIRVRAASLHEAREFLQGNPVYESGGTVEIRELPRDDT